MYSLELSPMEWQQLEHQSKQQGMTVNEYAISKLFPQPAKQKSIADLVKGKHLESFDGDPVAIQRALRDE